MQECKVISVRTLIVDPIRYEHDHQGETIIPKLKVLVVNWRDLANPEAGGAEVHLHEIFGRIARMGHAVTLLTHRFAGSAKEEIVDGMRVIRVGRKFNFNFHVLPYYARFLKRERFDVVIEDLNKLPFFLPFFLKTPTCVILHHFFGSSIWNETNPLFASYVGLGELVVRHTYRHVPFCVVSESTAQELYANGFSRDRIAIVHNAVDHSIYLPSEKVERVKGKIIYLGRVKKYKGIDLILHSLAALRKHHEEAHLVVVGRGDDLPRLKKISQDLGLENVVNFLGFVDTEMKVRLLCESEVMITPSRKEGWGVTTIEANACGTPVVASDVPGLRDAVRNGETGYLVPFGDVSAMTEAVGRLLDDQLLREKFAYAAVQWANGFTWESSAEKTLLWLQKVINERKGL